MGRGRHASGNFHRDLNGHVLRVGNDRGFRDQEGFGIGFDHFEQFRCERADDAVGQQHAEEGADQRAADHRAEHFDRLVDRAHCLDDAEHGGDDADCGQAVGHDLQRVLRCQFLVVVLVDIGIHCRFKLVRVFEIDRHHPQIVADEFDQVMVLEQPRIGREQLALRRRVEMRFDPGRATLFEGGEQAEHHGQEIAIVARLPALALERAQQAAHRLLDRAKRIGDDERPDRCAHDRHQFVRQRLQHDRQLAAREQEAPEDAAEDHYEADTVQHDG